jgi:hypothetical protein
MPTTKVLPCGLLKAMSSNIGSRLDYSCGSTENVRLSPSAASSLLTDLYLHSRFWEECTQARLFRSKFIMTLNIDSPTAHRSSRISNPSVIQDPPMYPTFSLISRTKQSRMPVPYFHLSSFNSAINPRLFVTFSLAAIHPTKLARNNPVTAHS